MGHGVAVQRRHRLGIRAQVAAFIQRQANEPEARMVREIGFRFGDDESSYGNT
jgi:hypothetical protein